MEIPTFELLTIGAEDEAVVKIVGELDLATAPRLREALVDLSKQGAKQVTIDLAEMEFIDSTGLSVLVAALKRMRENGGDLALQSPSAAAMKVFEITGAARVFTITDTPVDATNGDGGENGAASSA
jgi:anti-sigma B factor antagonist